MDKCEIGCLSCGYTFSVANGDEEINFRCPVCALKALVREMGEIVEKVKLKSVVEEWPDCGKPYWCCEICGECTDKGESITHLVHEIDCLILTIKEILSRPDLKAILEEGK